MLSVGPGPGGPGPSPLEHQLSARRSAIRSLESPARDSSSSERGEALVNIGREGRTIYIEPIEEPDLEPDQEEPAEDPAPEEEPAR